MFIKMQERVSKSEFKARALEFFRQVEASGQPLVITDHGTPVLEIRPFHAPQSDPRQILQGSVRRYESPTEPVGSDDWDALA